MQSQNAIYDGAGMERDSRDPGRGNKHPVITHSSQNNHSQKLRLSTVREISREVPQWGTRSEYHPGGENKINKEQGEGGKREKERERKEKRRQQTSQRAREDPSLSHDCSLHWRLERYGFSSETWKALSMCMLRGRDFTQVETGLTSICPWFHMDH